MTKFEQLLDFIVNEEHEKANELFHEIVVEKSREIYENLIAEEEEEMDEASDEEMDEAADEEEMDESADEDMDEAAEDDEEVDEAADEEADESMDLEDSYMMDGGDDEMDDMGEPSGLEKTDDLEGDISADEEDVEFNVRDAIEKLEAALAALGGEGGDDMGDMGDEMPDSEMPKEDDMMGVPAFEGRRMTREYREKVGNDWEKNSQKSQGQYIGAGTGEKDGAPVEGRSPIASGANKPGPAGVNAKNLNQSHHEGQSNTGTSPNKPVKGINPEKGEKFASGIGNVDGKKSGVKTLTKQPGHGAEKKGAGPGPVGSGSGDKAGQTSMGNQQSLLKSYK